MYKSCIYIATHHEGGLKGQNLRWGGTAKNQGFDWTLSNIDLCLWIHVLRIRGFVCVSIHVFISPY